MKLHTFQELVSRIAHLSTRDGKPISVTWSGTYAYTSTKSLNIPALPAGTILTPHQFSIWMGYILHEAGHQTHTDLNLYSEICKQRNNPIFSYILNLLEDIRIENEDIKYYPGDRKHLDSVHQFVDDKIEASQCQNPEILGLIYKHLFVHHRNFDSNRIQGQITDKKLSNLLSKIDLCNSTKDVIILADKVIKFLQEQQQQQNLEQNQEQEQQEQDNSKKDQQGNNEKNQENSYNENQNNENNDNKENNNKNSTEENSDQNSKNSEENNTNATRNPKENNYNFSNSIADIWQQITEIKNIQQNLKQQIDDNTAEGVWREPNTDTNTDTNINTKSIFPPQDLSLDQIYIPSEENLEQYNQTRTECNYQILALKKMFRIYLQAQTQKSQIRGLEEGKLDTQRLYIAATGAKTIFKDTASKLLPDTAIELMIDMSGSMQIKTARTAAIILAEALNSISQIKLSISGFTTNLSYPSNLNRNNLPPNTGRCVGMDILQFKNFSEPYIKCKAKLGAIRSSNLTPLGDAYGKALEHIIPRTEPRRIIFVITDGKPAFNHGGNHSDYLLMEKVHKTAKHYKIQTLGLGIGDSTQFLNQYFDQAINITDTETLSQNLMSALKHFI